MMMRMLNNNNRMKSKSKSNNSNSSSHQHQHPHELVKKKLKKKDGPYYCSLRILLLYLLVGCVDGIWTSTTTTTTTTNREGSGVLQDGKLTKNPPKQSIEHGTYSTMIETYPGSGTDPYDEDDSNHEYDSNTKDDDDDDKNPNYGQGDDSKSFDHHHHDPSISDGDDDENIHKRVIQEPFMVKYQQYLRPRPVVGGGGRMGRMLQSNTTPSTTCSNVSESFQTTVVFAYQGNKSLLTDQQLNLLGEIFGTTYNSLTSTATSTDDSSSDGSIFCDPLFRTITSVKATSNVSFTGSQDGEVVDNPLPIIPVRKRRLDERKHKQQEEEDSSTLLNDILWKSLVQAGLVNDEKNNNNDIKDPFNFLRGLQQQPQQSGVTSSNRTVASFDVGLILLDIFGACRGCQGNSPSFSLFDDISRRRLQHQLQLQHHQQIRQQQQQQSQTQQPKVKLRGLQDQQGGDGNDIEDCTCPVEETNTRMLQTEQTSFSSSTFQTLFNDNIEALQDSGEIDFVEEVNEIIEVTETQCPTKDQDFSTVHLISGMEFSSRILFNLGGKGAKEVEKLFRDSYNGIAQQLCDPLYRAISKSQFVSIIEDDNSESTSSTSTVTFEFVAEATCRGDGCTDNGCIFDGSGNCQQRRHRRRRQLGHKGIDHPERLAIPAAEAEEEEEELNNELVHPLHGVNKLVVSPGSTTATLGTSHGTPHPEQKKTTTTSLLMDEDEEEAERCFCRKARSERSPTQNEFNSVFQKGLDKITEENKLRSCQVCDFDSDCRSSLCLFGRCAEEDTGLLQNGCDCNVDSFCESGFCLDAPLEENGVSGVCTTKLQSCQECNSDSDCLTGFCLAGRCGDSTGLLEVGCPCLLNANCGTTRCDVLDTGTCQPKLASCAGCTNSTDCTSGFCIGGRCGESLDGLIKTGCDCQSNYQCQSGRCVRDFSAVGGVAGECTSKIIDTCTQPCLLPNDCVSSKCGSVVCLPNDDTLLPNGCLALVGFECESSRSKNNVCVPLGGLCEVCSAGTDCNTGQCTNGRCADSNSKLPNDCSCLEDSDCASGSCQSGTCTPLTTGVPTAKPSSNPSSKPTAKPSSKPSSKPTAKPSSKPSSEPSTSPTTAPSSPPTLSPSTPPTTSPSSTPTTAPSSPPTLSPSTPPTTSPSSTPTTAPSSPPTLSPSTPPTTSPSSTPTTAPSSPPTLSPSASPTEFCPFTPLLPDSPDVPNLTGIWEWNGEPGIDGVCFTQTGTILVATGLPVHYSWDIGYGFISSSDNSIIIALDLYKNGILVDDSVMGTLIDNNNVIDFGNGGAWIRKSSL